MGDELIVRGGGATSIATDTMLAEIARLGATAAVLDDWSSRAATLRLGVAELVTRPSTLMELVASPVETLAIAARVFASSVTETRELSRALAASAERYGDAERFAAAMWQLGGQVGAHLLGLATPALLIAGALGAARLLPPALLARQLVGPERADAAFRAAAEHTPALLSDPAFGRLVRSAADSADEFLAGVLRMPMLPIGAEVKAPENAQLLLAAAGVIGLFTGARALRETSVKVRPVESLAPGPESKNPSTGAAIAVGPSHAAPPPRGIGDLADRVPSPEPGEPQVRIERYGPAQEPRWIVYTGGTIDFGATPGTEPFDTTSNLHTVGESSDLAGIDAVAALGEIGEDVASGAGERAIRKAMEAARIAPGDPVIIAGHSAGGMAAANLAADPGLNVVAAVNFGGPTAQVDLGGTPLLSVEHDEDFVPGTAGWGAESPDRLTVTRSVADEIAGSDGVVPAHSMQRYRATAEHIDASEEPRLQEFSQRIRDFTGGGVAATSYWHAAREGAPARSSWTTDAR